jgi:hypothetical protein
MSDIRIWLDRNRIDLSDFKLVTLSVGNVAFEAQFGDLGNAALFRAAFGSPAANNVLPLAQPVTRRLLFWRHRRAA